MRVLAVGGVLHHFQPQQPGNTVAAGAKQRAADAGDAPEPAFRRGRSRNIEPFRPRLGLGRARKSLDKATGGTCGTAADCAALAGRLEEFAKQHPFAEAKLAAAIQPAPVETSDRQTASAAQPMFRCRPCGRVISAGRIGSLRQRRQARAVAEAALLAGRGALARTI